MTSNIIQLKNPRTELYNEFKHIIKGIDFNWNYIPRTDEASTPAMLSHAFIKRPNELRYPTVHCDGANFAHDVLQEILYHNGITLNCIYRMNLNKTYPQDSLNQQTPIHVDHEFPHSNLLIYFTSHQEGEGGQIIYPIINTEWNIDPKKKKMVLEAIYNAQTESIDFCF